MTVCQGHSVASEQEIPACEDGTTEDSSVNTHQAIDEVARDERFCTDAVQKMWPRFLPSNHELASLATQP
jgi:hypothetical protein